jgi:eukaryotic-like serine/threonine-protein kinase
VKPEDLLQPGALLQGALFRSLVAEADSAALEHVAPGARFGPFRLVRELGRGGMGIVFLAERDDGEFRQSVALKCLADPGNTLSQDLFRQEREILAELRHPHIARLLDGGRTDGGLLWFAMELIEGERIDRHCRRGQLGLDERLGLFLDVLEAVEFAHRRLLIHRDIKPGNVLVDADGRPKLLDFGISSFSQDPARVAAWSPGYASPEQLAQSEVGTASDQYQLGLLFDAMLRSEEPPEAAPDANRARQRVEPAAWLPMPAMRRRELKAIIDRTLREDPEARFGSVAELRQEIERLLARQPAASLEGGIAYRLACLLRRRPFAVPLTIAAVLAIAGLSAAFSVRLAAERNIALGEAAKARAIASFVTDDLLAGADPFAAGASDLKVREVLDRARGSIGGRFDAQPEVEAELRTVLARSYLNIGEIEPALEQLDLAEAALPVERSGMTAELARIHLLRADVGRYRAEFLATAERVEQLIPQFQAALGPDHEWVLWAEVLRHEMLYLGSRIPESAALADALWDRLVRILGPEHLASERFLSGRGHREILQGNLPAAEQSFGQLVAQHEARLGRGHPSTLQSLRGQARVLRNMERYAEAEAIVREVLASMEGIFGRRHHETLDSINELALLRSNQGDADGAIEIWKEALDIKIELIGEEHQSTMITRYNLARQAQLLGRYAEARHGFQALYEIEERVFGPEDQGTTVTLISLGAATYQAGDAAAGMRLLDDARGRALKSLAGRPELGVMYSMRAEVLIALERYAQAREELLESIALLESTLGPDNARTRRAVELLEGLP